MKLEGVGFCYGDPDAVTAASPTNAAPTPNATWILRNARAGGELCAQRQCILAELLWILAEFRENPWYLVPMGTHRGVISRVFR